MLILQSLLLININIPSVFFNSICTFSSVGGSRAWIIKVGKTLNRTKKIQLVADWYEVCVRCSPVKLSQTEVRQRVMMYLNKTLPIFTGGWGTAAAGVTLDQMAWEAGTAATGTEEMPQISEACPDLLSAVYWHANTSGLYVIARDHSLNYLLLSGLLNSGQIYVLQVYLDLMIIWKDHF